MTAIGRYDALASLAVVVDRVAFEPIRRGNRETTLVSVRGMGEEGAGEDVTHDRSDRDAFRRLELATLRGHRTVGELLAALTAIDLAHGASYEVVVNYRRWAIESALVDLALRQAESTLGDVLGLEPRPVRFVVSPPSGDVASIVRLLARGPGLRLKLDPRSSWSRRQIEELAHLQAVEILDLKGTYPGTAVYQPPDARLYRDLVEVFPDAWIEDPGLTPETMRVLEGSGDRIAWDEPVRALVDLERLAPIAAVNVKPSRLGSLEALLEVVGRCRRRGLVAYGGGHSEIGPGRGQIQLLAALLYPDAPNDVAPVGYDDPAAVASLSATPLLQSPLQHGFR